MTTDAITTPANAGSASAQPSTDLNDPANLDFEDESEVQTTGQEQGAEVDPERETDEAAEDTADQEAEQSGEAEGEAETESEGNAPVEVNVPDDALVTLSNGEKVKFGDLKKSPFLEADYTRDKQRLATERKTVTEQATRLQGVTEAFVNFLVEQLPAEPTPQLALEDPGKFIQQKAFYDAAVARIQGLIEVGNKAKTEVAQLSETELQAARQDAAMKVAERLPFLRDPAKAREFDRSVNEAASFIGFTPQDVAKMTDPRHFLLAHYAAKGIKAEQAEKKVAQKVQAAPQTTPAKKAQQKGDPQFLRNKEALRRLDKSGRLADAMAIEFD